MAAVGFQGIAAAHLAAGGRGLVQPGLDAVQGDHVRAVTLVPPSVGPCNFTFLTAGPPALRPWSALPMREAGLAAEQRNHLRHRDAKARESQGNATRHAGGIGADFSRRSQSQPSKPRLVPPWLRPWPRPRSLAPCPWLLASLNLTVSSLSSTSASLQASDLGFRHAFAVSVDAKAWSLPSSPISPSSLICFKVSRAAFSSAFADIYFSWLD